MCKNCILLGALFNASEADNFPSHVLSQYDFKVDQESENLRDKAATEYLKDTLEIFRQAGIELIPLTVDSDGSCLPHALSRGLIGVEIFYDCLRASMVAELQNNRAWYRQHMPISQYVDEETFGEIFAQWVEAASPTRGQMVGREKYLEGVHIIALANVLMRPILLLDTPLRMFSMSVGEIDGCGMYLPLRHSRADIERVNGRCAPPLIIGWSSAAKDHYVALVAKEPPSLKKLGNSMDFSGPQGSFFTTMIKQLKMLDRHTTKTPEQLHRVFAFVCLPPLLRDKAAERLVVLLKNINRYLDGEVTDKKYLRIKESNPELRHSLFRVPYCLQMLELIGFREVSSANAVAPSNSCTRLREFECMVEPSGFFAQQSTNNSVLIAFFSTFCPGGVLHGVGHPNLPAMIETSAAAQMLFGIAPVLSSCLAAPADGEAPAQSPTSAQNVDFWDLAVKEYGDAPSAGGKGSCWLLSTGSDGQALGLEMKLRAMESFKSLSAEADWALAYEEFLAGTTSGNLLQLQAGFSGISKLASLTYFIDGAVVVKCPICYNFVQFQQFTNQTLSGLDQVLAFAGEHDFTANCPRCLTNGNYTVLSLKECLYARMNKWLKEIFSADPANAIAIISQHNSESSANNNTSSSSASASSTTSSAADAVMPDSGAPISINTAASPASSSTPAGSGPLSPLSPTTVVHPRLWACQNVLSDGKLCKIANLRGKSRCSTCNCIRTDLSAEELAQLNLAGGDGNPASSKRRKMADDQIEPHLATHKRGLEVVERLKQRTDGAVDSEDLNKMIIDLDNYKKYIDIAQGLRDEEEIHSVSGTGRNLNFLLKNYKRTTELQIQLMTMYGSNNSNSSSFSNNSSSSSSSFSNNNTSSASSSGDMDGFSMGGMGGMGGMQLFDLSSLTGASGITLGAGPGGTTRMILRIPKDPNKAPELVNNVDISKPWVCTHCTYENTRYFTTCEMCSNVRDSVPEWKQQQEQQLQQMEQAGFERAHVIGEVIDETPAPTATAPATEVAPAPTPVNSSLPPLAPAGVDIDALRPAIAVPENAPRSPLPPMRRCVSDQGPSSATTAGVDNETFRRRFYATVLESYPLDPANPRHAELLMQAQAGGARAGGAEAEGGGGATTLAGRARTDLDVNNNNQVAPPAAPERMRRQVSAPGTQREGRQAQACISRYMREEKLMWDEIRAACLQEE